MSPTLRDERGGENSNLLVTRELVCKHIKHRPLSSLLLILWEGIGYFRVGVFLCGVFSCGVFLCGVFQRY